MNRQLDIEQLLDIWLDEGPTDTADAVFDAAVARIYRQRQRPAWRFLRREPSVTTPIKILLAAAVVMAIAVVGGTSLLGQPASQLGGPPAPSPSATPTPRPSDLPGGRISAGTYIARAFPRDPMAFTVTVPDGWSGLGGWAIIGPAGSIAPAGVMIAFMHDPRIASDPCTPSERAPSPAPSRPQSVDELVAALSAADGVSVTQVADTTLGGYAGKRVDLELPAVRECAQHYVFDAPQGLYAQGPSNRWNVWIVDVDGEAAVVALTAFAESPPADREAAQAIVDSITIEP